MWDKENMAFAAPDVEWHMKVLCPDEDGLEDQISG